MSALCLNTRGLEAFVACKPFERIFKVLLSPDYLPAMRRRRSSDPMGDTASNLGNSMDELMRHQPSLRTDATTAIIKVGLFVFHLHHRYSFDLCLSVSFLIAFGRTLLSWLRSKLCLLKNID